MNISQLVDKLIARSPFLEEALSEGLINVSSLARNLQPELEKISGREIQTGAIIMAINRRPAGRSFKISKEIKDFMSKMGDVIVRSDLHDFTIANSAELNRCNQQLMEEVAQENDIFCTISQGVFETTIVASTLLEKRVEAIYAREKILSRKKKLSSITIKLPEKNTEVSGIYYFLMKNLAWAGINICEVISTTNEITIVVDEKDVHDAFSILLGVKSV
ncbi:MAG: hypothetical protein ACOC2E_03430 [Bacteroidota bacterium]